MNLPRLKVRFKLAWNILIGAVVPPNKFTIITIDRSGVGRDLVDLSCNTARDLALFEARECFEVKLQGPENNVYFVCLWWVY